MSDEPEWVARKAEYDAMDDGYGPYIDWMFCDDHKKKRLKRHYQDFMVWAKSHFGQGYSLACREGGFIDHTTMWAHVGFVAGREHWYREAAKLASRPNENKPQTREEIDEATDKSGVWT